MGELSIDSIFNKYNDWFNHYYTMQQKDFFSPTGYKYVVDFRYLKSVCINYDDRPLVSQKEFDPYSTKEKFIKEIKLIFTKQAHNPLIQNFKRLLYYKKYSKINYLFRHFGTGFFADKEEIDHIEINSIKINYKNFIQGGLHNTINFKNSRKLQNNVFNYIIEKINNKEKLEIIFYGSQRSNLRKELELDYVFGCSSSILNKLNIEVKNNLINLLNSSNKYGESNSIKMGIPNIMLKISKSLFNKDSFFDQNDINSFNCHKIMNNYNFTDVQELFIFLFELKVFLHLDKLLISYTSFKRFYNIN